MNKAQLKETIQRFQEGSYPFDQCLSDNEGKYGVEGAKKVCGAIKAAYGEGLVRENRIELYKETLKYLKIRVDLDLALIPQDVWSH